MQNSKNAKRSLNEAWGTGNAQNQYFASHTSDWGRQSNNQYSLLATNEGFEESFPSLPSSRSDEVQRMGSGHWQQAPVIRTGPKRKPKRRKFRAENTLIPTLPSTRGFLASANSAQSEDNVEDIALLEPREAAMQNLLNQLGDANIEDIEHVTSAEESERFMDHLKILATATYGETMDNPPPVSNPPQGNQKAAYLGYRGPNIQEFVFDYQAVKVFWKLKNPSKKDVDFHNSPLNAK